MREKRLLERLRAVDLDPDWRGGADQAAALNSVVIPATIEGYDAVATALARDADNPGAPIVFDDTIFARRGNGDYYPDGPRPAGHEATLREMAERGLKEAVVAGVKAARARGAELGELLGKD